MQFAQRIADITDPDSSARYSTTFISARHHGCRPLGPSFAQPVPIRSPNADRSQATAHPRVSFLGFLFHPYTRALTATAGVQSPAIPIDLHHLDKHNPLRQPLS
jgi:hypothetical protein